MKWKTVDENTPTCTWLETKREGEDGTNICFLALSPEGDPEWVEKYGARTTVTHHSFAAPTHWRRIC